MQQIRAYYNTFSQGKIDIELCSISSNMKKPASVHTLYVWAKGMIMYGSRGRHLYLMSLDPRATSFEVLSTLTSPIIFVEPYA